LFYYYVTIKKFISNPNDDKVLISPSIYEGLDCADDLSKFCIITKVPYGNLGDPFIKARMEIDPLWYQMNTLILLVQLSGRSIRSATDTAATYVLDTNFDYLLKRNLNFVPKWWAESIIR